MLSRKYLVEFVRSGMLEAEICDRSSLISNKPDRAYVASYGCALFRMRMMQPSAASPARSTAQVLASGTAVSGRS